MTSSSSEQPNQLSSTEPDLSKSPPPQVRLFKGQIILNPTISIINFCAFLLYSTYVGAIFIPANLLTLPLLKIVYGVPSNDQLNIVAITQVIMFAFRLLFSSAIGILSDRFGRKPVIIAGLLSMSIAIALTPNLPSIDPYYFLILLLTDTGIACLNGVPLLADYVDYETKGRVAGISTVLLYISSFGSTFFISKMNLEENIPSKYHELAILGLALGLLIALGLKGGTYHKDLARDMKAEEAKRNARAEIEQEIQDQAEQNEQSYFDNLAVNTTQDNEDPLLTLRDTTIDELREEENEELKPGFKAGILEARNPWILIGYVCSFLSLAFYMLVSNVFVNLVTDSGKQEDDATQAYALTNKHLLTAIFCSVFYGFFADKYNKFKIIMFITVSSLIGTILIIVTPSFYGPIAYLSMVFFGISTSGFFTFVAQLTSKYPNPKYRASAFAISGICSSAGAAMTNILGALLGKMNRYAAYYLYLGAVSVALVVFVVVYCKKKHILNKI